jgi:16S rRNA (adenine1518-N6/adenine1519-N6)-dimethyltransferase
VNTIPVIDSAALLGRYGFRPRKRLGQNFLQNPGALERIAAAARINRNDTVLEIGCGFGSLTRHLAEAAEQVVAIELDVKLAGIARELLKSCANVRLICADILELAPRDLALPEAYIVAANIPYYVTSPILRHLLESDPAPRRIVLTVQKEVAARICARPPDMSLLGLSVQVYGSAEIVAEISADAFYPKPKVDSAVVRIESYRDPVIPAVLLPVFFRLAKSGFLHRRKTLRNTLAAGLGIPSSEVTELLNRAQIDPQRRAETLTLDEWAVLTSKEALRPH